MQWIKWVLPAVAVVAPLWGQLSQTPIATSPLALEVGYAGPAVQVMGNGFQPDWQVLWNGDPRPTTFLSQYRLSVALSDADVSSPSLSFLSVVDASGQIVRVPAPVWVYVPIMNNDFRYDPVRKRFWVAVPTTAAGSSNGIAVMNPETGAVERFIPLTAEPQRLCLSDDARFLYIAMPGRIQRLNTETLAFDLDFAIGTPPAGWPPFQTYAMTTVPGQPDLLAVSIQAAGDNPGGLVLFDRGVPRPSQLSVRTSPRELPGWTSGGKLIGLAGALVDLIDVLPDGLKISRQVSIQTGSACQYSGGLLYCNSGYVVDPEKGSYIAAYPAKGNVAALPEADRIVYIDTGLQGPYGGTYGLLTILRLSTGEPVYAGLMPFQYATLYGPLSAWGSDGFAWRDAGFNAFNTVASRLYIFHVR